MIPIGQTLDQKTVALPLKFGNRHGLVTGATGTGKTVTLQALAEQFSRAGVPVFAADVKGDLSGIAALGDSDSTAAKRHSQFIPHRCPVALWDIFGERGLPIRTSIHALGPELLASMLRLNETQAGTLAIAFKKARDDSEFLLGTDDLRWALNDMLDMREEICKRYGNITSSSIAAIQRNLLALEAQGGANLFGEPPFKIADFLRVDENGHGVVNLLHADQLLEAPKLYATFLLWLLTELFRNLPEAGDLPKPKLVFFFDEAHLLFHDAPKALLQQIERLVRLVRSKGVGVFFVSQSPADIPDTVLAQLGNRVQHVLRAYTPKDQRLVKAAVQAFRPNKGVDVRHEILNMGIGEALVSVMLDDGVPSPVEKVRILPPQSQIGPISDLEREVLTRQTPLAETYTTHVDAEAMQRQFIDRMREEHHLPPIEWSGQQWQPGDFVNYLPDIVPRPPERPKKHHGKWALVWLSISAACAYGLFA
ncbi:helicase HerA-like domain-containing protein [Pseudorhizobium flavum]|uniref:helicase HerA-like domain-containing protein n=1 Tax=Pseudorhizobium flavum TaxID=1335061 RepID=UPI0024914E2A|nr:helicase HerA-like domain-containing protein [Pseudorhizobium flavum]